MTTHTYRVTFDRVGRGRRPEPQTFTVPDGSEQRVADDVAAAIHGFIRNGKLLKSRFFDVTVDLTDLRGWIEDGRFGEFTLERVP